MTESIEKHYYGANTDGGLALSRANQAAELGWTAYVHYHSYTEWHDAGDEPTPCSGECRKVRLAP
jgi:hypothetical protein